MDKLLLFSGKDERGIFTYVIDTEYPHLIKTASEYHPEIAAYIAGAKKLPGYTQLLLTALGAGEYWGCNVNGDYFPEKALAFPGKEYGFKTFEHQAKVYKHHINKDPKASYGDVTLAVYNPTYHRVELIVKIDEFKAPDIISRIDDGDYPDWSMGCRVPFDVCSVCSNRARNRAEYCSHLKYYMGRIDPESGKQAYAINLTPKFFDISMVLIGADRIAKSLKKVAFQGSGRLSISSAFLADKMFEGKTASMEKDIPVSSGGEFFAPGSQESLKSLVGAIPEVKASEKPLPREVLNDLGQMDLKNVMSSLAMLGILPKPQEFQRIFLVNIGKKNIADQMDDRNIAFDPMSCPEHSSAHERILGLSHKRFDPSIMNMLSPFMSERSYAAPHLGKRLVVMIKQANEQEEYLPNLVKFGQEKDKERSSLGILPVMLLAAGLYSAFGAKAPREGGAFIDNLIQKHPGLLAALGAGGVITLNSMVGAGTKGQFDPGGMPADPDMNDLFQRTEALKQKSLLKIGAPLLGGPGKRLLLGIPGVYMASGVLQKHRQANPYEQEGRIKSFIRRNPDVLGLALAADAVLGKRGTRRLTSKIAPHARSVWHKLTQLAPKFASVKLGSAEDYLSQLGWAAAFGRGNFPARAAGYLFDQAVFDVSGKLLSKKGKKNNMQTKDRRI